MLNQINLPPQVHHHNPHAGVNYARAAREEMRDVATHPPHTSMVPGAATGAQAWDRVRTFWKGCLIGVFRHSLHLTDF
jgi:hypothetical protein